MPRFVTLSLFLTSLLAAALSAQKFKVTPLHVPAGTVLTFHLQTRLHPSGDALDALPKGTVLHVKILDSIDSASDQDGSEFHGAITTAVLAGNATIVHPDAEVHGVLALLRSKSHPDGFRYELLITSLNEPGAATIALTASLNTSFSDDTPKTATVSPADPVTAKDPVSRVAFPTHR